MDKVFDLNKFKSSKQPAPASTPKVRKQPAEPFVQVTLELAERVARLTRSPTTLVLIELLYAAWKARGASFPLPNARFRQLGVSRNITRKVLLDLECGKVIAVQRLRSRAPIITMLEVQSVPPRDT
jgi:hypothetical protein